MRLTAPGIFGPPDDREECRRVLRRTVELGVNFIDTANSYGPYISEEIIAEALFPYPSGLVIATKAGYDRPGPFKWVVNGRPEHLKSQCEGSLRRLKLDRIDLFQLHRVDPDVSVDDQLGALDDLCRAGKIRYVGFSEVGAEMLARAKRTLPVVSVQNKYNVTERTWEPLVEYCEQEGLAFIPWYPLAAGVLNDDRVSTVAARHNATAMQVALAWLLARSPVMLPIPGTSKVSHLEENMAAARLELDPDDLRMLDVPGRT